MNTKAIGLTVGLLAAGPAFAGPVIFNTAADFSGNGSSATSQVNALGYSGTRATSFYSWTGASGDPLVGGAPTGVVVDTNSTAIMNELGFASLTSGPLTAVNGDAYTLPSQGLPPGGGANNRMYYPQGTGEVNIDTLNPFASGSFGDVDDTNGYGGGIGGGWNLTYEYAFTGGLGGACSNGDPICFTDGFLDVFYSDTAGTTNKKVAQINVSGSSLSAGNLFVTGSVDYSWLAGPDAFVENFIVDANTGDRFFDIWQDAGGDPSLSFVLDTNVNPPTPTFTNDVVATDAVGGAFTSANGLGGIEQWAVRQTTLDGSAEFSRVPEPSVIMLFGAGVVGLGFAARRRKMSAHQ